MTVSCFEKALRQAALERCAIVPAPAPAPDPPSEEDNILWIDLMGGFVSRRRQWGFLGYVCATPAERDALLRKFERDRFRVIG